MKSRKVFILFLAITLVNILVAVTGAWANCGTEMPDLKVVEPAMQRWWQKIQQQTQYPWGKARPYGALLGNRITLSPAFDQLSATQKNQVLGLLLDNEPISPYEVYASDGRAISLQYDGCNRYTLWTEEDRFKWYEQRDYDRTNAADSATLRNAERPSWRQVNFPIAAVAEKAVRLKFWNTMSYRFNGWISWVPERGYFEIDIRSFENNPKLSLIKLQKFWRVAPRQYRYFVVDEMGTILENKTFLSTKNSLIRSPNQNGFN